MTPKRVFTDLKDELNDAHECFLEESLKEIQRRTPVRSGRLRDSWEIDEDSIITDVDYAEYVEYGTVDTPPRAMVRTTALGAQSTYNKCYEKVRK